MPLGISRADVMHCDWHSDAGIRLCAATVLPTVPAGVVSSRLVERWKLRSGCAIVGAAMIDKPTVTALETKEELLAKSKRKKPEVPIRHTFVQQGTQSKPKPGPVADFVRRHDHQAFDQYVLALAVATAKPYDVNVPAEVWARALGLPENRVGSVSKAWARLEDHRLIVRHRYQRLASIRILREDGSGQPYSHPGGERGERYFRLSFDYWREGWDVNLSLPAKAVLLIALSLSAGFILPSGRAPIWYGMSSDTIERGLRELDRAKLLRREKRYKKAPLAPKGYTEEWHYTLRGPFHHRPRRIGVGTATLAEVELTGSA